MFRKLLLVSFLLLQVSAQAQNIQNITYIPASPGPLDSVKVVVDLVFTSGSCEMQFENHSINNDSIRINVFHCPGALTVICNTSDTVNLGILNPGTYITELIVHTSSWSAPDPCSDVNPTDSASIPLTVLPPNGIKEFSKDVYSLSFNYAANILMLHGPAQKKMKVLLFNSLGALVLEKEIDSSMLLSVSELGAGVYFYTLLSEQNTSFKGKISVH